VATDFLQFKNEQLVQYGESQWSMLVENDLEENEKYVEASQAAIESFAKNLIRNETELIFGITPEGTMQMTTNEEIVPKEEERGRIRELVSQKGEGWTTIEYHGVERVAWMSYFPPFNWYFFVTEEKDNFYHAVDQILYRTIIIISLAVAISVILLLIFTRYLILPLRNVVSTMKDIISTHDLSKRVDVIYNDETGELGHSFNLMTSELEKAYTQIKNYALQAVVAQHKEQKIRNIFQKYVPNDVINQFIIHPESMLVGEDRELVVLFSDIRSFTSISEQLDPHDLVESLNAYFTVMVDIIFNRNGIVDKYIGDAIMAFYGAPVKHDDDVLQATLSGIEMIEALETFNKEQVQAGKPQFKIGVGINYGLVTVGNIGSERKMDYTVIGDMVNLASRLEGLSKKYKEPLIISESVYNEIRDELPCRLLDKVIVKGKSRGIGIYTVKKHVDERERMGWDLYEQGLFAYYSKDFRKAASFFSEAKNYLDDDYCTEMYYNRSVDFILSPPSDEWTGLTVMSEK
jgi:class 3 adenylate cyclase/HAMP domain-containing protein